MQMKRIFKNIIAEMRSAKFWIAVIVISILCFCANVDMKEEADPNMIIYNMIFHNSKAELLETGEELCSSYSAVMSFRKNHWFPIIVPIVAAIPYINRFGQEWLTGYYYMRVHRSQKRISYALENVFMAVFTGFLTICIGILIFGIVCLLTLPSYDSYGLGAEESIIAFMYGPTQAARVISFVKVLIHTGLLGSIASMISLIMLTIFHDCFMALTVPMMLIYVSTKVANYYVLFNRKHYADDPPVAVRMLSLLIPSTYIDMENAFGQWFGVPIFVWYAYLLLLIGIFAVLMIYIVKRRDV